MLCVGFGGVEVLDVGAYWSVGVLDVDFLRCTVMLPVAKKVPPFWGEVWVFARFPV